MAPGLSYEGEVAGESIAKKIPAAWHGGKMYMLISIQRDPCFSSSSFQAADNPNFKFHYTVDSAPSGWTHSQGFITKEVILF